MFSLFVAIVVCLTADCSFGRFSALRFVQITGFTVTRGPLIQTSIFVSSILTSH